jgi:hypothetical protein
MRRRFLLLLAGTAALSCAPRPVAREPVPATSPAAPAAPAALAGLAAGWNTIRGGPNTTCSLGTPFWFYVRPGNSSHLLIFLDGGGACWTAENCDARRQPSFNPALDTTVGRGRMDGIFDYAKPENPFSDYTTVYVPYCTGDVHLGDSVVMYHRPSQEGGGGGDYQIRHRGHANVQAVLSWLRARVPTPEAVFVAGASAGAIPSPYYAEAVARQYPRARITQLGDGAGGYRAPTVPGHLYHWGAAALLRRDPAYAALDSTALTYEALYMISARKAPRVMFAQINAADDETQRRFLGMVGQEGASLPKLLAANLADIRRAAPNFHTFTLAGSVHTILQRPQFYTASTGGVSLRDWVAALAQGGPARDVGDSLLVARP